MKSKGKILLVISVFGSVLVILFIHTRKMYISKIEESSIVKSFEVNSIKINVDSCPESFITEPSNNWKKLHALSMARSKRITVDKNRTYSDTVVIMTPISNAGKHLKSYFSNLCRLTYPHHLISLALIEDSSHDDTYNDALKSLNMLHKSFSRISLLKSKENLQLPGQNLRHAYEHQISRRGHLAKSRNALLSQGLKDEKWVLWLDSDVQYIPADLVEQLLAAEKDIVVPACMFQSGKNIDVYDKNSWKETEAVKLFLKNRGDNFLMLEGYGPPMRLYLNKLKDKGNVVEIDGVGACVLLIRGDLHRKGLVFPHTIYKNHIETEGLARMAQDMGFKIYGLPSFEVYHE